MTENEWLECSDPMLMLQFMESERHKRKCLLFASACERRLWNQPDCEREKVEVTEAYADGQAAAADVFAALERIGIEGVTLTSITEMKPAGWADEESNRSADYAAKIAEAEQRLHAVADEDAWSKAFHAERAVQANFLRDIFGNPFRPVRVDPSWLTPNVTALARTIYTDRAFDAMPILADALEEAGCTSDDILTHCRGGGEHARGCWAVDLILGKE
jgi:hypothetical protein